MIEDVLSRWQDEAAVLERHGHADEGAALRRRAVEVSEAMPDYLRWLTESEAVLWSSRSLPWLRRQYPEWEAAGYARREGRHRYYRSAILPRGPDLIGVRALAREDAACAGSR